VDDLQVGTSYAGKVKSVLNYGAFIDIGKIHEPWQ
jgi:ribosomal protein S1